MHGNSGIVPSAEKEASAIHGSSSVLSHAVGTTNVYSGTFMYIVCMIHLETNLGID